MNDNVEQLLLEHIRAIRGDMMRLADDVRTMRSELAEFRASTARSDVDAAAAVRRLWDEGLASGDAGDLDDVFDEMFDELAAGLPTPRPAV